MMSFMESARLFKDCWALYRAYFGKIMTEDRWEDLIQEAKKLHKKYGQKKFAKDLIVAILLEIERMAKSLQKGDKSNVS